MHFSKSNLFSAVIATIAIANQFVQMTVAEFCPIAANRPGGPFNINYELHGSGSKRVMLVTGLGGSLKQSRPQAEILAKLGYSVAILDNRGVGDSGAPPGNYTIKEMALDTLELLDHIGWSSDVNLVGASMGGMIAMETAIARPKILKSLTLSCTMADTTLPMNSYIYEVYRKNKNTTPKDRNAVLVDDMFPKSWLDAPSKSVPGKTNRQVMEKFIKESVDNSETDKGNFMGQAAAVLGHVVKHDRLYSIRQAGVPTLVCVGDSDKTIPPTNSYIIADTLGGQLEVFADAGHAFSFQDPERYTQLLTTHFENP
ncbi:Alpha/Beta hydrolase protein [Syncephalis fuscata]|nr:Alpha/Beta hydrolase protein [Syncephalis fuscata]